MITKIFRLGLSLGVFLVSIASFYSKAAGQELIPVPPLTGHVVDLTETLNSSQKDSLERYLSEFEIKTGSQIVILLVSTTKPEEIEQYSIRVVDDWRLGRSKIDDGILLLVAKEDRRVRIEVGYGLEGVLPDYTAKQIIESVIIPKFRVGDFYGGVLAGVEHIIGVVVKEPLPMPKPSSLSNNISDRGQQIFGTALVTLIMGLSFFSMFHGRFGLSRVLSSILSSTAVFGMATLLAGLFVGLLITFLFFIATLSQYSTRSARNIFGGRRLGRGFGGFGRLGGGGFSGRGGSFGGGGASGRW